MASGRATAANESLRVDKNDTVWQGNTRIMILQRGYNVDSLSREPYP